MSVQQVLTDAAPPAPPHHRRVSTRRLSIMRFVELLLAGSMFLLLGPRSESTVGPRSGRADAALAAAEPPTVAPLPSPPPPSHEMLTDERLSRIDARQDALDATLAQIGGQIERISAEFERLDAADVTLDERITSLVSAASPKLRRPQVPTATAPTEVLPTLVSVDLWGGHPSAAIRGADGKIRFYAVGDTIGVARLQSISPDSHSVVIEYRNGKTSTLKVRG